MKIHKMVFQNIYSKPTSRVNDYSHLSGKNPAMKTAPTTPAQTKETIQKQNKEKKSNKYVHNQPAKEQKSKQTAAKPNAWIEIVGGIGPIYYLETDKPSGRTWARNFSSSDNPSVYKCGQQTDYPSRRTIRLVRLGRRTKVDNPSGRIIRLCL